MSHQIRQSRFQIFIQQLTDHSETTPNIKKHKKFAVNVSVTSIGAAISFVVTKCATGTKLQTLTSRQDIENPLKDQEKSQ